ncbi:MAG: ribonuclease P protein component [Hyphomicrobiaceae bacterium]
MPVRTLKRRAEFLRIRGGGRSATPGFVLEGKRRAATTVDSGSADSGSARFGFTVTKKLGGAVVRNRIRRRLRAAVSTIAPASARDDFDYVLIAREAAFERPFAQLLADLERAFSRVNAGDGGGNPRRARAVHRSGNDKQLPVSAQTGKTASASGKR